MAVDRNAELLDNCMFCKAPTDRLFWTTRSYSLNDSFPVCLPHWTEVIKPAEHILNVHRVMEVV